MHKIDKIASVYVMSDEAKHYDSYDYIANDCHADNINRKYPLHSKEACERSMAEYLYDHKGSIGEHCWVAARLEKAAKNYGLSWPSLVDDTRNMVKISAMDGSDILELEFQSTPEGIMQAANTVLEFRKTASYMPCKELAEGVLLKSAEVGCDVPEDLVKLAGYAAGTKENALNVIGKRAHKVGTSEFGAKLQEMAEHIQSTPGDIIPHDDLAKIAAVLDAFDGLREDRGYSTYNTPPEQELFNKSAFDLACDLEDEVCIKSLDTVVSKKDLEKSAGIVIPILNDMGIECSESDIVSVVASLNEKQANYLFGALE